MGTAGHRGDQAPASVLLFTPDPAKGQPYAEALAEATIPVECVATASALRSRLARADLPRPALIVLVPSPTARLRPADLATVASYLAAKGAAHPLPGQTVSSLDESLDGYCAARALSGRQRQVLALYLTGNNDKEIASSFNCSAATVYEYWRRMARKANGLHKSDVVNDFHRFLAARDGTVTPSVLAAPRRRAVRSRP